jgi:hypothetical protein
MSRGRSSFSIKTKSQGAAADIVSDTLKIRRYLLKGFHDPKAAIELQPDGTDQKIPIRVLDADFRKDGLWIELTKMDPRIVEGAAVMFMIYSPDIGVMGFRTKLEVVQQDCWLNVGFPDRMVRTQKRLDPRYTVPRGYELFVEFKKPPVEATETTFSAIPLEEWARHSFRIFDVSSTGLGFIIPEALAAEYPKGMRLRQVRLRVRGREVVADAEVMSCLPHRFGTSEPSQKVGIRFTRITLDDEATLRAYVVENLIQYDTLTDD